MDALQKGERMHRARRSVVVFFFGLGLIAASFWSGCSTSENKETVREKSGEMTATHDSGVEQVIHKKTEETVPERAPEPVIETPTPPDLPKQTGGKTKWSISLSGKIKSIALSPDEKHLYITSNSFAILDASNGDELYSLGNLGGELSTPVVGPKGLVYFGSDNSMVYAVDPKTRRRSWSYRLKSPTHHYAPAVAKDGTLFIVSKDSLYAFQKRALKWKQPFVLSAGIVSHPTVANDGTIYICGKDNTLQAITKEGKLKWSKSIGKNISCPGVSLDSDGTIYVGGDRLYAFKPDGSSAWSAASDRYGAITTTVSIHKNYLYFGTYSGKLYKAIKTTGQPASLLWEDGISLVISGSILFSPTIGATGVIFIGHNGPALEAYEPARGRAIWSISARHDITGHPALASNGILFLGTSQGTVYAVTTGAPGLASSPWPKGHRNNFNSNSQR